MAKASGYGKRKKAGEAKSNEEQTEMFDDGKKVPPSRQGVVPVTAFVHDDIREALKILAAKKRTTLQKLIANALRFDLENNHQVVLDPEIWENSKAGK